MNTAKFLPRVWLAMFIAPKEFLGTEQDEPMYSRGRVFEFQETNENDCEYLSLDEHQHLLKEAVSKARASAFNEAAEMLSAVHEMKREKERGSE